LRPNAEQEKERERGEGGERQTDRQPETETMREKDGQDWKICPEMCVIQRIKYSGDPCMLFLYIFRG
jgi:hypothetical protein